MSDTTTSVASHPDSSSPAKEGLRRAEELKLEGNDHFRARRWDDALCAYRSALGHLPGNQKDVENDEDKGKGRDDGDDEDDDWPDLSRTKDDDETSAENSNPPSSSSPPSELDLALAKARAVLNANIGACYVKLNDHKEAVAACTQALEDDPQYIKALQRRAASNEILDTWSSLTSAQEDYQSLLKILPSSSADYGAIQRSLHVLKPRLEAAQKRETAEMVDKLKGLGNNILGKIGLSTDNFKFEPNGQGGYSMRFEQNP